MAINREQARAAGYTDQEIDAFEAEENTKAPPKSQIATADVDADEPPAPTTQVPQVNNTTSTVATVGGAAAEGAKSLALPAAEIAAGGYGLKKFIVNPINQAINQMGPNARKVGPDGRIYRGGVPSVNEPMRPVASPQPAAPPAQPTAMNFLERMAGLARTYAPLARGATGVAAAVTPGNAGQNYSAHFPQTGPARGMEINPATGAPWTAQELQQYSQFNR